MEIENLIKMPHIMRWSRFRVNREQNLAEHSYMVTSISYLLYQCVVPEEKRKVSDLNDLLLYGLFHDSAEMFTGDVASPFKDVCRKFLAQQGYAGPDLFESVEDQLYPEGKVFKEAVANTHLKLIAKLADTLDAIAFIKVEGVGQEVDKVIKTLTDKYIATIEKGNQRFKEYEWYKAYSLLSATLNNHSNIEQAIS